MQMASIIVASGALLVSLATLAIAGRQLSTAQESMSHALQQRRVDALVELLDALSTYHRDFIMDSSPKTQVGVTAAQVRLRLAIAPAAPCLSATAQSALRGVVQSRPDTVAGAVVNGALGEVLETLAAEAGAPWLTEEGEGAEHIVDYLMRDRDNE